jgi:hypothetical protein
LLHRCNWLDRLDYVARLLLLDLILSVVYNVCSLIFHACLGVTLMFGIVLFWYDLFCSV